MTALMIRARLRAAVQAFCDPGLVFIAIPSAIIKEQARRVAKIERQLPGVHRHLVRTALDQAIKLAHRHMPREEDDLWWDGYDAALSDTRGALLKLKDGMLQLIDEVPR